MPPDVALPLRERRVPVIAVAGGMYWLVSGTLLYAISSGNISVRNWFERGDDVSLSQTRFGVAFAPEPPSPPRFDGLNASVPQPTISTGALSTKALATELIDVPELEETNLPKPFESAAVQSQTRAPEIERAPAPEIEKARVPEIKRAPLPELKSAPMLPAAPAAIAERTTSSPPLATPAIVEKEPAPAAAPAFSSCEAALAAAHDEINLTGPRRHVPDLPREAFSRVLDDGRYLSACNVPDSATVDICAAIQNGRVIGVTVVTRPRSARLQSCIASAVRRLSFPHHPKVDVTRTHFDAAR